MLTIRATVDARALLRDLERGQKRLAFAVANGLNHAAKQLQAEAVEGVEQRFTLRSATAAFVKRQAAIIKPFASARQGRPFVEISVGQRPRLLLSQFEEGGKRKPVKGRRVARPITGSAARPSHQASVPKHMRFTALGMKRVRGGGGEPRFVGKQRTFMLPDVGVFQRVGPRREDVVLLYYFDEDVQLPRRLGFRSLAERAGARYVGERINAAIARELARR